MKITVSLRCVKPFCWAGEDKAKGDVIDGVPIEEAATYAEWFEVVEGSQSSTTAGPAPSTPTAPPASRFSRTPEITEGDPS